MLTMMQESIIVLGWLRARSIQARVKKKRLPAFRFTMEILTYLHQIQSSVNDIPAIDR